MPTTLYVNDWRVDERMEPVVIERHCCCCFTDARVSHFSLFSRVWELIFFFLFSRVWELITPLADMQHNPRCYSICSLCFILCRRTSLSSRMEHSRTFLLLSSRKRLASSVDLSPNSSSRSLFHLRTFCSSEEKPGPPYSYDRDNRSFSLIFPFIRWFLPDSYCSYHLLSFSDCYLMSDSRIVCSVLVGHFRNFLFFLMIFVGFNFSSSELDKLRKFLLPGLRRIVKSINEKSMLDRAGIISSNVDVHEWSSPSAVSKANNDELLTFYVSLLLYWDRILQFQVLGICSLVILLLYLAHLLLVLVSYYRGNSRMRWTLFHIHVSGKSSKEDSASIIQNSS